MRKLTLALLILALLVSLAENVYQHFEIRRNRIVIYFLYQDWVTHHPQIEEETH